jgi:AraC-like DNA-binding protein
MHHPPPTQLFSGGVLVGRFARDGNQSHPPVSHDYAVLMLCLEGQAEFEQGQPFHVEAGDMVIVPAGAPHRLLAARGLVQWGLGFSPAQRAGSALAPWLTPFDRVRSGGAAVVSLPQARQSFAASLFQELENESQQPAPGSASLQESLLALLLREVSRASASSPLAAPGLVARALSWIETHSLGPVSLRDLAESLGRSPAHLTTALRRATGRSAQAWIIAHRLAEARRLLALSDASIEEISARVGYADPTHLIRLFRRQHGATPSAWRSQQRRASHGEKAPHPDGALVRPSGLSPLPCDGFVRLK